MDAGDLSALEALIWPLVIFIGMLVFLLVGMYGLLVYWQKKTTEDLNDVRSKLRSFQNQIGGMRTTGKDFSRSDPAPFGPVAERLETELNELENGVRLAHQKYGRVRTSATSLSPTEWRKIFEMPYHWYQLRQETKDLVVDTAGLSAKVEEAGRLVDKLERLGWQVAEEAREIFEMIQAAIGKLTRLQAANIYDHALDAALNQGEDWEDRLNNRVPVYFLSEDEAAVLSQADKPAIVNVYQIVEEARPVAKELLSRTTAWEQQLQVLGEALEKLVAGFRELNNRFTELESTPNYPIEWNHSRSSLLTMRQQIESITAPNKRRTLDELRRDFEKTHALSETLTALSSRVSQVAEHHKELQLLLETPEIQQGEEWSLNVQKLVDQIKTYNPENWPRGDQVESLPEEVQALTSYQRRMPVKDSKAAVRESELPGLVDSARRLASLHQAVRPRVNSIQTRLHEIRETERNTRDAVSRTRALLAQAEPLIAANPVLARTAHAEAQSMVEEMEQLYDAIQQPGGANIDRAAQKANQLIRKVEQNGNRWLEHLTADLFDKRNQLAEKVDILTEIANLDDPLIVEARRLSRTDENGTEEAGRRRQKLALPFAEVVPELKRKNETWQRCVASLRAVEDIQKPVLERYERAEQQRQHAAEQLARAVDVIPDTRSWPPTTQMLTTERRQFKLLEDQWAGLREQPGQALGLISKLSDLSEGYASLAAKLDQILERAGQDQERVSELQQRLEESKTLWTYHLDAYSDNPVIRDEIQTLLEHIDQEMVSIQTRYIRGSIPYNQVVQNIRVLCQKLDSAQVALDNLQVIDINGVVQRRM